MGNSCVSGAGAPPALVRKTHDPTFQWKVHGFSALLEKGSTYTHCAPFHFCGYKWFLELTPMYTKPSDGVPYISLALCLNRLGFKTGHVVNAVFELSIYNHSKGTYNGCEASYGFSVNKTHSEKMCVIRLEELLKSSDFLVDDSCVFGVRILKAYVSSPKKKPLVISKKHITVQKVFLQKKGFIKGSYTWNINNYLDLKLSVNSPAFEVGGHKWHMSMYPNGDLYSNHSLSLFVHKHNPKEISDSEFGTMIEVTLSILDQKHDLHLTATGRYVFPVGDNNGWGWSNFVPLRTFRDPSKGYLVGSKCVLKADITIIGSSSDN